MRISTLSWSASFLAFVLACSSSSSSPEPAGTVNGCQPALASNHLGQSTVTIRFGGDLGNAYSPACARVSVDSQVVFEGDFSTHPLVGGQILDGVKSPDSTSPIPTTLAGTSIAVDMPTPGSFGFYCNTHGPGGMKGALFVEGASTPTDTGEAN